jgi:hypothetical protein
VREKLYYCGGAEEPTGGDGDAAATVAHALKGGDGEGEWDADAAAVLPHAVVPEGTPSAYYCGGERSVYCYGGAEEPKAVTPVGAPSAAAAGLYGEGRIYI